jgi:hypothetical protein
MEGNMGKDSAGFTSAKKGRCESGLSGIWHFGNFTDVDGL